MMAISFQGAILYKKTSSGKIQQWKIFSRMNEIVTVYGHVDGKQQETVDVIAEGKNEGRANSTTPDQQAYKEAEARWTKQLKKRYVKTIEEAQAGEVDEIIDGGVTTMLAHSFEKHGKKVKYPAMISPKLDGIRCMAVLQDGICSLFSRTRKSINSVPHIQRAVEAAFSGDVILDGEIYHSDYKDDFNKIISLVRPDEPVEGHEIVQYHVFDIVDSRPFLERYETLVTAKLQDPLVLVLQSFVDSEDDVMRLTNEFISQGYEGGMVKSPTGPYEHKRSYLLQKVKFMQDAEFKIVGVDEGRGKLLEHVGSFICETDTGLRFNAKLKGATSYLKYLFEHQEEWQGKMLTVQYQNLTPDGIPRFPIGLAIRDYE